MYDTPPPLTPSPEQLTKAARVWPSNVELARQIMDSQGFSKADIARLCRVSPHTVNAWFKPPSTRSSSEMPDSAVELLYLKCGLSTPEALDRRNDDQTDTQDAG